MSKLRDAPGIRVHYPQPYQGFSSGSTWQDITDTASNYLVNWTVNNTGTANDTVYYCFVVHAEDGAESKDGTANPNIGRVSARTEVTWNP